MGLWHPGLEIRLEVFGNGSDSVRIPVAGRGDGLSLDALSCIFESFYRVTEAHKHQTGGTGLSLSIA
jgi:signal transduction histidine kinase